MILLRSPLVLQLVEWQLTEKAGRGSTSLLASFLLHPLYVHKQTCLYLLCGLGTFCWGTEKQEKCHACWVFHIGSNQLQWFTIAQLLNVHRVVRKNDLVPLDTKELVLHSLLSGMEDCWNILPHILHNGPLCPAVGTFTVTVTGEKEITGSPQSSSKVSQCRSLILIISLCFAVVQLLVSRETSWSPNIISILWL